MKKFIKFLALSMFVFTLTACANDQAKEKEQAKETTAEVQTTVEETTQAEKKQAAEPTEKAVTFKFFINGEENKDLSFFIEDAEGLSVKEAMEAQDKVKFNFNKDEGIIDTINDVENNYSTWETWAYLYNGQFAELGVVSQKLKAGDEIHWYYGTVDQIPTNIIQEAQSNAEETQEAAPETTQG